MREYLLGLATLPALAALAWSVIALHSWVREWERRRCGLCDRTIPWGPPTLMRRAHYRIRHSYALTLRGRLRKRQYQGVAWEYARRRGIPQQEYDAVVAEYRRSRRVFSRDGAV